MSFYCCLFEKQWCTCIIFYTHVFLSVKCSLFCQQGILLVHQWSGCSLVKSTIYLSVTEKQMRKKVIVKMQERTKSDACEGHLGKTAPSPNDYIKYSSSCADLACFKQQSTRPTVIWPPLSSTKWVKCQDVTEWQSVWAWGRIATQTQPLSLFLNNRRWHLESCSHVQYMLAQDSIYSLQPSWSNRNNMSLNFAPVVQGLL